MRSIFAVVPPLFLFLAAACGSDSAPGADDPATQSADEAPATTASAGQDTTALPPGEEEAAARLAESPRHGEWVTIPAGDADSVRAWVVYPERSDRAPVVVVVHEIYGLTSWVRSVADQLAADGFIAIAPDLLSGQDIPTEAAGDPEREAAVAAVRALDAEEVQRRLDATAEYGTSLPAALPSYGIVGFCWGGSTVFEHAVHAPSLDAAVVYYGSSPETEALANVEAPVLGLYGDDDARVNATIPPADSAMQALGKTYEQEIYDGAGHGFLRAQAEREGANLEAASQAWPRTIEWFRTHLGE